MLTRSHKGCSTEEAVARSATVKISADLMRDSPSSRVADFGAIGFSIRRSKKLTQLMNRGAKE